MPTYNETIIETVKKRVNTNKDHGWGVDDSTACIVELIVNETGEEAVRQNSDLVNAIRELVNPSAFRQKLETKGILNKSEKDKKKRNSVLDNWQ